MSNETDWTAIINEEAPPRTVIRAIAEAMDADTYTREGKAVPDHRTRLAAAQTLVLHSRGRPAEAPETKPISDRKSGLADLMELLDDPEIAQRVAEKIAKAKAE